MMQVVERSAPHYDVQEVEFGRVYRWCPECVVVECDCGERMVFKRSELIESVKVCECGASMATVREELDFQVLDEEAARPWRSSEDTGVPF